MLWWTLLISAAFASDPDEIAQWLRSRPSPEGQYTELTRFGFEETYAQQLAGWVRAQLVQGTASAISRFQQGQCQESSTLKVLDAGFAGLSGDATTQRFESSVFRLETTGCLSVRDIAAAAQIYDSAAFRTAEMPNLAAVRRSGNQLCLRSHAVPGIMAATDFCLTSSAFRSGQLYVTHNALNSNNTDQGAVPVFYREEVIVFSQLDNGVGLYRMIWTRGQDIGMAGKAILQRTSSGSQARIYRALEEWAAQ